MEKQQPHLKCTLNFEDFPFLGQKAADCPVCLKYDHDWHCLGASHPRKAATAAAASAGTSRWEIFVAHLAAAGKNLSSPKVQQVLNRIAIRYNSGVDSAAYSEVAAVHYYELVKDLPETKTKLVLESHLNLHIGGPVNRRYPNILSAIDVNQDLFVIKLLYINCDDQPIDRQPIEFDQEQLRCSELSLANPSVALCPVEVIEIEYEHRKYAVLKMPRCISTLYDLPRSFTQAVIKQGQQLVNAVSFMHDRDIVHMDIKADNIFVHNKRWLLGDFGSSKHKKEKVTSTNLAAFVRFNIKSAQPKYDWFMLLMVLLKESLPNKHKWLHYFCDEDEKYDMNRITRYINDLEDASLKLFFQSLQDLAMGFEICEEGEERNLR